MFKLVVTYCILLFFVNSNYLIYGQNRKYYEKLKANKKESIEYSKKLISELKSTNEDKIYKLLITKEQINKQKEILNILNKEIILLDEEIVFVENKIASLLLETNKLKDEYARLIQFSYLNFNVQQRMIYILSADNFNKAYKRMLYLKQLTEFRKSRFIEIHKSINATDSTIQNLKKKRIDKALLQSEKSSSIDSLEKVRKQLNTIIANTKNEIDKVYQLLNVENQKKEITKQNVTKQISIQEENKPAIESKKSGKLDGNVNSKFESNKKWHIWPLSKFVILHHYGDYSHPVLDNIIVKNDGIELGSKAQSNVHCIFEGKVVNIIPIPGDGTSIIIKHGEYYSVYSKVSNVIVKPGDVIQKGQVIAKLGSGGNVVKMNFQLWKGKEKLNPELWLKRQ